MDHKARIRRIVALAESIAQKTSADIFYYSGPIIRQGYEGITQRCVTHHPKKNAYLVLATNGGEGDAAYRIARALRHNYQDLHVLIPGLCKSAGTLLVIGATSLIISDCGELGPLDVQISKPDEMFESSSGLDIMQALNIMQRQVLDTFRDYLLDIKLGSRITAKTAAEIASKLAVGIFTPIYAQIDPLKLGEVQRAIAIAYEYGERLDSYNRNLQAEALVKLVSSYPSHGFVIDRKEARSLFKQVRASDPDEHELGELLYGLVPPENDHSLVVLDLLNDLTSTQGESNGDQDAQICDDISSTLASESSGGNEEIEQESK